MDVSDRTAAAQTWRGGPGAAAIEEEEREPDVGRIEQAGAALCVAATLVTEGPVAAGATRNTVSDLRRGEARQVSDAGGLLRHWRREVWRLATASRRSVIQWMSPGRSWRVFPSSRKCRAISCRHISRPTPRRDRVCSPRSAGWECGRRWLARATRRSTRIVVADRRDGFRHRPVRNALAEPGQARRQRARPARGIAGTRRPSSSRPRRRRSRPGHGWRRQDKSPRCWLQWSRFAAVGPWWGTELFPVRLHGGRAAAGHPYPRAIETIRDKASNRAVES